MKDFVDWIQLWFGRNKRSLPSANPVEEGEATIAMISILHLVPFRIRFSRGVVGLGSKWFGTCIWLCYHGDMSGE